MSHLISHLVPHLAHPNRPSWLRNQVFGCHLNPDDLITPQDIQARMALHPYANLCNFNYYRPWIAAHTAGDTGSTVAYDKDRFKVDLDVQQFAPNEVMVKIVGDNVIMVEGKHEEKEDEHGFVYRHFVRKYVLPKGYSIDHVESLLSSDGVLTITAPKVEKAEDQHRHVPIKHTGQPSRPAVADPKKGAVKNAAK